MLSNIKPVLKGFGPGSLMSNDLVSITNVCQVYWGSNTCTQAVAERPRTACYFTTRRSYTFVL